MPVPAALGFVLSVTADKAKQQFNDFIGSVKGTVAQAFPGLSVQQVLGGGIAGVAGGGALASNLQAGITSSLLASPIGRTLGQFGVGQTSEAFGRERSEQLVRTAAEAGIPLTPEFSKALQSAVTARARAGAEAVNRFRGQQPGFDQQGGLGAALVGGLAGGSYADGTPYMSKFMKGSTTPGFTSTLEGKTALAQVFWTELGGALADTFGYLFGNSRGPINRTR